MTAAQYDAFVHFRDDFRAMVEEWSAQYGAVLQPLQRNLAGGGYPVETPIVYNTALDKVGQGDSIKLIIVGDNPGKDEQLARNRAYMVGRSGRLAAGFFRAHSELGIEWGQNVIVLNKTPVYTAQTAQLRTLSRNGEAAAVIHDSQVWMAEHTVALYGALCNGGEDDKAELWVTGYGQLRHSGVFEAWKDALIKAYALYPPSAIRPPLVYQHFSMNRFAIDLRTWCETHGEQDVETALRDLGEKHCRDIIVA